MSIVKLACPNPACRHYCEPRLVQVDSSHGHLTLRNAHEGDCDVCSTQLEPYDDVLAAA